jgi:hypothetical protein
MLKTVSSITNAIGALNYKGTWNASTNTPTLASGVGTKGDYYVVSVAGSTNLDGETLWGVGDWAVYNGAAWQKVEGGNTINATTVSASTSVTTPIIQATSSAGGTLKNNGGTAQLQWGSGGGSNLSLEVATNINPANAAVAISPTGTGTVTINPATASTMNNVAIGGTTPLAITGTTITATGVATFSAGTAGAPAITTTGDTNTGIFFPAADTIAFSEGGVEAMRINSSQYVGIGTSSPAALLNAYNGVSASTWDLPQVLVGNNTTSPGFVNALQVISMNAKDDDYVSAYNIGAGNNIGTNILISNAGRSGVAGTVRYVLGLDSPGGATIAAAIGTASNHALTFGTNSVTRMSIDTSGGLILVGSTAQKATGTTWSNPSDIRLKEKITDYTKGLAELMQVKVKEWEYNGKGGTAAGTKGLGVIADEIITVLPNTVENYQAKLNVDDKTDTYIKKFDATEITWLMLNSIKEQQAIITNLTARLDAQQEQISKLEGSSK